MTSTLLGRSSLKRHSSPYLSSDIPCHDIFLHRMLSSICLGCNSPHGTTFSTQTPSSSCLGFDIPYCPILFDRHLFTYDLTPYTLFNMLRLWNPASGHPHIEMLSLPGLGLWWPCTQLPTWIYLGSSTLRQTPPTLSMPSLPCLGSHTPYFPLRHALAPSGSKTQHEAAFP